MSSKDWIWMPHAGHLCVGDRCKFHLNTYVNGYIVSTVGEYFPDQDVRRIYLQTRSRFPRLKLINKRIEKIDEKELINKVLELQGDAFDYAYLEHFGYEEIGCGRLYETMVFKGKKSEDKCCPYAQASGEDLDFEGYNSAEDAFKGHYEMCRKWDNMEKK